MSIKLFLLLLLSCTILSASNAPVASGHRGRTGLLFSGSAQFSPSIAKSSDFPYGVQLGYQSGGSFGYSGKRVDFLLNAYFHDAFHSFASYNVIYRRYKGFLGGVTLRIRDEDEFLTYTPFSNLGVGIILEGAFDRYYLINQYMIYPRVGVELYSAFCPFRKLDFLVVNLVVPVTYSFRQSGNYLETGLRLETMLRL